MTVHIAVMDYSSGTIKMYAPDLKGGNAIEEVENWLYENTDYSESQCYYMTSKEEIKVEHL